MQLYFVMLRRKACVVMGMWMPAGLTFVASYHHGLAVFHTSDQALTTAKRLRRERGEWHDIRVLPWHTEMGEVDPGEMWRSALTIEQVQS